jgi:elongation factor G
MSKPSKLPKPIIRASLEQETSVSSERISFALSEILVDDPSLEFEVDPETHQIVLHGMSEQHLELVVKLLKREYDLAVTLGHPHVIYMETIRTTAIGEGKYIRQTGGSGNYAHVKIRIGPNEYGGGYEFANDSREDSIPVEFVHAIDQGIQNAMQHGVLNGYEMVDINVSLYDGSYHNTDSNEMSFKIAASMAFKESAKKAKPVRLEPVMNIELAVPHEYMGPIIDDLNSRRGWIEDVRKFDGVNIIRAIAPLSTILGYSTQLRMLLKIVRVAP